ncbi:MAG TPA: cytochrome c [Pyrinomonadaceae bacterium]|nr:cytochrome c [Pyrinomonadaceae bacterium]
MKQLVLIVFLVIFVGALSGAFATRGGGSESVAIPAQSAAASYAKNCASCHGRDGQAKTTKGRKTHARNLVDPEWQARVSDERIFNSIMNGKGKMPEYSKKLSEQEIDALVNFVRSFR